MAEVNISARLICHNALKHMLAVTAPESIFFFWGGEEAVQGGEHLGKNSNSREVHKKMPFLYRNRQI